MYETRVCTPGIANMLLHEHDDFRDEFLEAVLRPAHLDGPSSTPSSKDGAINRADGLCSALTDWLMTAPRQGMWACKDPIACGRQHECKAGLACNAHLCYLLHPTDECRWVVLATKRERRVVAMTLDEALQYSGDGGMIAMKGNAYTRADVWRACTLVVTYGRKKTPVGEQVKPTAEEKQAEPAPREQGNPAAKKQAKPAPGNNKRLRRQKENRQNPRQRNRRLRQQKENRQNPRQRSSKRPQMSRNRPQMRTYRLQQYAAMSKHAKTAVHAR